jgi:hypothetical protein
MEGGVYSRQGQYVLERRPSAWLSNCMEKPEPEPPGLQATPSWSHGKQRTGSDWVSMFRFGTPRIFADLPDLLRADLPANPFGAQADPDDDEEPGKVQLHNSFDVALVCCSGLLLGTTARSR